MISESQQEQAALYALGLLDADEASAFETQTDADADLRALVWDLREAAAMLALTSGDAPVEAPPALRGRVLAEAKANGRQTVALADNRAVTGKPPTSSRAPWFPWAVAALFSAGIGALLWLYVQQLGEIHGLRGSNRAYQRNLARLETEAARPVADDSLTQMSFCALEPTPEFTTAQPRAAVLWDPTHHQGKLRINRLAPPAEGKDYQLWAVEAGRKDTVSAGVVHVDADGKADISFQPVEADGGQVVAVAISLERAGGSPTNQGPVLLLGKF